jgi:hypothetical protein
MKVSWRQATDWTSSFATAQLSLVNTKCWISDVATAASWGDSTSSLSSNVTPKNNNHLKLVMTKHHYLKIRVLTINNENHCIINSEWFISEMYFTNYQSVNLYFCWFPCLYAHSNISEHLKKKIVTQLMWMKIILVNGTKEYTKVIMSLHKKLIQSDSLRRGPKFSNYI